MLCCVESPVAQKIGIVRVWQNVDVSRTGAYATRAKIITPRTLDEWCQLRANGRRVPVDLTPALKSRRVHAIRLPIVIQRSYLCDLQLLTAGDHNVRREMWIITDNRDISC